MPRRQQANSEFGEWVKAAREAQTLTQKDAATQAGIKQQIWSRIERYGIIPSTPKLIALCAALNKPVEEAAAFQVGASNIDVRVRNYELDYLEFKRLLTQRANTDGRTDMV